MRLKRREARAWTDALGTALDSLGAGATDDALERMQAMRRQRASLLRNSIM